MTADGGDRFLGAPRFDVVLRGYDRRQVDEHIARLQRVIQRLRADLEISRSQPQHPQHPQHPTTPGRGFRGPATPDRGVGRQPEWGQRPPQQPAPDVVGGFTDRMQSILRAAEEEAAEIRRRAHMDAAGGEHLRAQVAELAGQRDAMLAELNRLRGRADSADGVPREEGRPGEPPRPRPRPAPGPRPAPRTAGVPLEHGPDGVAAPDARPAPGPRPPLAVEHAPRAVAPPPPGPSAGAHERTAVVPGPSPRPRPSPVPRPTAPHPTAQSPGSQAPVSQPRTADQPLPGTSRAGAPAHSADHSGTQLMPARTEQAGKRDGTDDGQADGVDRTVVVSAVRPKQTGPSGVGGRTDEAGPPDPVDPADTADPVTGVEVADADGPADTADPAATADPAGTADPADPADPVAAADTVVTTAVQPGPDSPDSAADAESAADADSKPGVNGVSGASNGHHEVGRATSAFRPG